MNCREIKDLLLTDYADNQLSNEQNKIIDQHLVDCASCREYAFVIQETVTIPFSNLNREMPSESIWQNIKETIEQEYRKPELVETVNLRERIHNFLTGFNSRFLAGLAVFIIIFSISIFNQKDFIQTSSKEIRKEQQTEQVEYVAHLITDSDEQEESDESYGQLIEQYFL